MRAMRGSYKLIGRLPVPCEDLIEWATWMETADRHIDKTEIGPLTVSTVFLGLDHSFSGGDAVLFETMVFDGGGDGYQERYRTWDEAEKGHARAVAWAQERVERANTLLGTSLR